MGLSLCRAVIRRSSPGGHTIPPGGDRNGRSEASQNAFAIGISVHGQHERWNFDRSSSWSQAEATSGGLPKGCDLRITRVLRYRRT